MKTMTTINTIQCEGGRRTAMFLDKTANDLFVFFGSGSDKETEEAQAKYLKKLKAGHTVEAEGKTQWITFEPILDENHRETYRGKAGEEQVKGTRFLVTLHNVTKADRSERYTTREVLGTVWRKAD